MGSSGLPLLAKSDCSLRTTFQITFRPTFSTKTLSENRTDSVRAYLIAPGYHATSIRAYSQNILPTENNMFPLRPPKKKQNNLKRDFLDVTGKPNGSTYSEWTGDRLLRVARSGPAEAGARIILLITMSLALTPLPYSLRFSSPSGRRLEPSSETPANSPREREYDRISARNVRSDEAAASRPSGPAATAKSPPSLTWLGRS